MPEKRTTISEAEEIELEFKRLQIELMREQIDGKVAEREAWKVKRAKMMLDMQKADEELLRRQRICRHRKGGKNNNFARGNDENRSIVQNTYPMGEIMIMCTRCFKQVWKPDPKMKAKNPEVYASMVAEWKEWSSWPTDNTPSGSKMFEISPAA